MGTSQNDEKSAKSKHIRSKSEQKTSKGSGRFVEDDESTAPANRGKPQQHDPGNNPQTFSSKISEGGPSDQLAKPRKSNTADDAEDGE